MSDGVSPTGTGPAPLRAEPPSASQAEPLVPDADHPLWVTTGDVAGQLARWAVQQSPYPVPAHLTLVLTRFQELWPHDPEMAVAIKMLPWTDREALYQTIWETFEKIPALLAWNSPKSGHGAEIVFVSRYGGPSPDDDFIDLHALCRNVCRSVWDEAMRDAEFDRAFDPDLATGCADDALPGSADDWRNAAKGIEAATAGETQSGSTEGESPVLEEHSPNTP